MSPRLQSKIAIVGKGAIGSLLAVRCHNLQANYQLLVRDTSPYPCQFTDLQGRQHSLLFNSCAISQPTQFDVLVLPIKAHQVLPALQQLAAFIEPRHVIVLLHNGMGNIEKIREAFPDNPCIAGTTSCAAFKPDIDQVVETGQGQTHLGWVQSPQGFIQEAIQTELSALLAPTFWHLDISLALWKKLAVNAVINPLTALHKIKNGELAKPIFAATIHGLCDEIAQVMNALGYATSGSKLLTLIMEVVHSSANNYSSMHQDMLHARPTEIDDINGYIIKMAKKLAIPSPLNQSLVKELTDVIAAG
jgi:2-dehydropantoate 2-reductase